MATLSIIVPVYNEAATIELLLDKVIEAPIGFDIGKQIIVVNDCSKDNSLAILKSYIERFKQRPQQSAHAHGIYTTQ